MRPRAVDCTLIAEAGVKVIAISNSKGIVNPLGLDIAGIAQAYRGRLAGEAISNEALLALECDVLVPSALGGSYNGRKRRSRQGKDRRRGC